jgi:hypothetical protein
MSGGHMSGGIDGSYRQTCIACLGGTDTGLVLTGDAEWVAAGLTKLGVENDVRVVTHMISEMMECEPGMVPAGEFTMAVRLCRKCAELAGGGVRVGLLIGDPGPPHYAQRPGR